MRSSDVISVQFLMKNKKKKCYFGPPTEASALGAFALEARLE